MKGKRWLCVALVLGVAITFIVIVPVVLGQHTHTGECNKRLYDESYKTLDQLIASGQQAVESEDYATALEIMGHIRRQSATAMAFCTGLVYQSESLGLQANIGPIEFPNGAYVMRVISNGAMNVMVHHMSGDCTSSTGLMFSVPAQQAVAPDGAEAAFGSQACVAMLHISEATDPWLIQFEPTGTTQAVNMQQHEHE
jgi:hypothetical protein